jgi:hypothetical protein
MNSPIREISKCLTRLTFEPTIKSNATCLLDWLQEHDIVIGTKTSTGYIYDGLIFDAENNTGPYFLFFNEQYDGLCFSVAPSTVEHRYYLESNGARCLNNFNTIKKFIQETMK